MTDVEVFERLPASVLRPWLEKERDTAHKYLAEVMEPALVYRMQGQVFVLQKMLKLLDATQKN